MDLLTSVRLLTLPPLPRPMTHRWLADRASAFDSSGIRKVFDLAAKMKDPINLSIGQPDFDVPDRARDAMVEAVSGGKNGYAQTQGITPLLEKITAQVRAQYGHAGWVWRPR